MSSELQVRIRREGESIEITIDDAGPEPIVIRRQGFSPWACEGLALQSVESILRGETHGICGFLNPTCTLVALPDDNERVMLDIRAYNPESNGPDYLAETSELDCTISLPKTLLVEEIVRWTEKNLNDEKNICDGQYLGERPIWRYQQLLEDAKRLLTHYKSESSLKEFEWWRSRTDVERYLFEENQEYRRSIEGTRTKEYILNNDVVHDIVSELASSDEDQVVTRRFEKLLNHESEIQDRVFDALTDIPDNRAIEKLAPFLWEKKKNADEDISRILDIFTQIGNNQVVENLDVALMMDIPTETYREIISTLENIDNDAAREVLEEVND